MKFGCYRLIIILTKICVHLIQWAFGVLLWELATLAQQPYAEVDPFEMAEYLRDGYRLVQPINCPDEL
jgi:type IV secretory pathway TrbD component